MNFDRDVLGVKNVKNDMVDYLKRDLKAEPEEDEDEDDESDEEEEEDEDTFSDIKQRVDFLNEQYRIKTVTEVNQKPKNLETRDLVLQRIADKHTKINQSTDFYSEDMFKLEELNHDLMEIGDTLVLGIQLHSWDNVEASNILNREYKIKNTGAPRELRNDYSEAEEYQYTGRGRSIEINSDIPDTPLIVKNTPAQWRQECDEIVEYLYQVERMMQNKTHKIISGATDGHRVHRMQLIPHLKYLMGKIGNYDHPHLKYALKREAIVFDTIDRAVSKAKQDKLYLDKLKKTLESQEGVSGDFFDLKPEQYKTGFHKFGFKFDDGSKVLIKL